MKNLKDEKKKKSMVGPKPKSEIDLLSMKQILMDLKITLSTYGKIRSSKKDIILQRFHSQNGIKSMYRVPLTEFQAGRPEKERLGEREE